MKKLVLSILVLMLVLFSGVALAEEAGVVAAGYDWSQLASVAGATAFTLLFVQFIKAPLDKVWKIPTRLVVYIVAFLVMLAAQSFIGGFSLNAIGLVAVNALLASSAAMGAYEVTFSKTDNK